MSRSRLLLVAALVLAAVAVGVAAVGRGDDDGGDRTAGAPATESRGTDGDGDAAVGVAAPDQSPPPGSLTSGWDTDFSKHSVSYDEIQSGGPPKDGIPAIDEPRFAPVSAIDFLEDREPVVALSLGGKARAYPIQILMWHEIVNDELAGVPLSVTFCPLCNTAIVFDRRVDGEVLDFGTTGNLRNSDLVMYDRQTESWWQQFSGEAIVGERTGQTLEQIAARVVSWQEFRTSYADGEVLTRDTGHARNYGSNPYTGYDDVDSPPFFGAANLDDDRLPPKERVVFLEAGESAAVVPHSVLLDKGEVTVEVGGRTFVVRWKPGVSSSLDHPSIPDGREVGTTTVLEDGEPVAFHEPFWFAVAAFRPDATIVRG